jgi:hypothetical protein
MAVVVLEAAPVPTRTVPAVEIPTVVAAAENPLSFLDHGDIVRNGVETASGKPQRRCLRRTLRCGDTQRCGCSERQSCCPLHGHPLFCCPRLFAMPPVIFAQNSFARRGFWLKAKLLFSTSATTDL